MCEGEMCRQVGENMLRGVGRRELKERNNNTDKSN